jgi:hypothetical protein
MPPTPRSRSENLRVTNRHLSACLDKMFAGRNSMLVTPEHMSLLLSELLRAGAELRSNPLPDKGNDPDLDQQLETYRLNVERLRELLPSIHSHLLAERSRLATQRARVRAVTEWATASRQTL